MATLTPRYSGALLSLYSQYSGTPGELVLWSDLLEPWNSDTLVLQFSDQDDVLLLSARVSCSMPSVSAVSYQSSYLDFDLPPTT